METEFNLSKRIMSTDKIKKIETFPSMEIIDINDVKEFIRLLKDETIDYPKAMSYFELCKIIDKLAGEKLNGI
jgi:hypothetical protein